MTSIAIKIDEGVLERAQRRAQQEGTSVDSLLEHYLEAYSSLGTTGSSAAQTLIELTQRVQGSSEGQRWTRDELYDRPGLP
jgi:hypothetical protein